jgi:hypothetical protein
VPQPGDSRVQRHAIHPGGKRASASKAGKGAPELNQNLLRKISTIFVRSPIQIADIEKDPAMTFYLLCKQSLCL